MQSVAYLSHEHPSKDVKVLQLSKFSIELDVSFERIELKGQ